jgi:hypothetical protein
MENIGSGTIKSFGTTTTPQTSTHDPILGTITDSSALINIPNGDDFFKPNGEPLQGTILKLIPKSDLEPNSILFSCEGKEMLKLCPNGDIFVHGRLADNDKEVVDALRKLLML